MTGTNHFLDTHRQHRHAILVTLDFFRDANDHGTAFGHTEVPAEEPATHVHFNKATPLMQVHIGMAQRDVKSQIRSTLPAQDDIQGNHEAHARQCQSDDDGHVATDPFGTDVGAAPRCRRSVRG